MSELARAFRAAHKAASFKLPVCPACRGVGTVPVTPVSWMDRCFDQPEVASAPCPACLGARVHFDVSTPAAATMHALDWLARRRLVGDLIAQSVGDDPEMRALRLLRAVTKHAARSRGANAD